MSLIRILKPGLFIYEIIRLLILVFILYRVDQTESINLIYSAPAALLPLMALFIWLDAGRYKAFLPLFLAAKSISIFIIAGWCIASKQVTMIDSYILSGDLFALAAILIIFRDIQKPTEAASITEAEPGTEEK